MRGEGSADKRRRSAERTSVSDVSHVVREFTAVVVNPLASLPLLPPSDKGGDQSVYLDSFMTEQVPEPENEEEKNGQRSTGNVISHFR